MNNIIDPENKLKEIIQQNGYITMEDFMRFSISFYYQNNESIGTTGDFITAPEISQLFGEMIGIWIAHTWEKANCPTDFILVEIGPGKGTMMNDILRATKNIPHFHNYLSVHLIETSTYLQNKQKELSNKWPSINFQWHRNIESLPKKFSIIISNEFFDALPVKQFEKIDNFWHEVVIKFDSLSAKFYLSSLLKNDRDIEYISNFTNLENGSIYEASPESIHYINLIGKQIKNYNGAGLLIDYGYNIPFIERKKTSSTIQSLYKHKFNNILENIGKADITAHVDFHHLATQCMLMSLSTNICNQGDFLKEMGILYRANILTAQLTEEQKIDFFSRINRLISYSQMGELFKVMTIYK